MPVAESNKIQDRILFRRNSLQAIFKDLDILSTTINLWLIPLTASKELSILLLKLYNDGAIGISYTFLDFASANKTDNQLLICSIRFMQVEQLLLHSCHTTVD